MIKKSCQYPIKISPLSFKTKHGAAQYSEDIMNKVGRQGSVRGFTDITINNS